MIKTDLMRGGAGIVESVALVTITILAIGLILSTLKPSDVARHLGTVLFVVILLLVLPAILVTAWCSMSNWQHLGIFILGILIVLSLRALR
jgi:hypothetical protein